MIETIDAESLIEPPPNDGKPQRQLSNNPAAVRARNARANKRAKGETPKRRTPTRRAAPASLKPEIAAFLTTTNMLLLMSPLGTRPAMAAYDPSIPTEKVGDELDAYEIEALAGALDAQCRRSPRFRKYVERMLTVGAGGQLVTVVGMIAARRAARHGLVPNGEAVDLALGLTLAQGDITALGNFTPPATPDVTPDVETGETPPAPLAVPVGAYNFETGEGG